MNRRDFIRNVSASLLVSPVLLAADTAPFPTRTLGRTGIRVPIIGFGSGSRFLMYKDDDQAVEAVNKAIDLGITYIDTAHSYGDGKSETRLGRVMATRRKEVVLATKINSRTAEGARRQIEESLKNLQTDHLDVLHIHDLRGEKDVAAIEAKGGVLEALYEAREKKITRAIGITCHANPDSLRDMLDRHDFDCTQMALNAGLAKMADSPTGMKATPVGVDSFESLALPVAKRKNLGVIAMKVFGQEQLIGASTVEELVAYALSLPVSLASLGMPRLEHIDHNVKLARAFTPMPADDMRRLSEKIGAAKKLSMQHFFHAHYDA